MIIKRVLESIRYHKDVIKSEKREKVVRALKSNCTLRDYLQSPLTVDIAIYKVDCNTFKEQFVCYQSKDCKIPIFSHDLQRREKLLDCHIVEVVKDGCFNFLSVVVV